MKRLSCFILTIGPALLLGGCGDPPRPGGDAARPAGEVRGSSFNEPAAAPDESPTAEISPVASGLGVPIASSRSPMAALDPSLHVGPPAPVAAVESSGSVPTFGDSDRPGYVRVTFNELAGYDYDPFDAIRSLGLMNGEGTVDREGKVVPGPGSSSKEGSKGESMIPKHLLALGGRKVCLEGFAMPIEVRGDEARSFLLLRNQMACCFGAATNLNEWVLVETKDKQWIKVVQDVNVNVYGTLEVGEDVKDGMIMSLYRMTAEDMVYKGGF